MPPVTAVREPLTLPTYPVGEPGKHPLFFEKRVYQGSSGKVYPLPFIDKVFDEPRDVSWQSVRLENEFVRLSILPEIGGRIFLGQDKTNHDYDFFYRQHVIKPALVGLAGPWISGGVEFNWPQHHRPGTFLPADAFIEEEPDGARTVWLSEHDPLERLKGMHGVRLRPGASLIELRVRLYNRTPVTQTFLWWANVAAMVHDQYQSFFPPDVHYVADHAVRAMSSFPEARNFYYGVPYHERPGANRLDWYKNIPVPTSYMVCQTEYAFFGGYDHLAHGGFVHVADPAIAPGKKQWTWGNHEFGWAWDRELTAPSTGSGQAPSTGSGQAPSTGSGKAPPYVELMAGVFTDNQPDFTYLLPFETKTFSQFWWPIRDIGPVQQATRQAALRLVVRDDRTVELGLCVAEPLDGRLIVRRGTAALASFDISLQPGQSWQDASLRFDGESAAELEAVLTGPSGRPILSYRPPDPSRLTQDRAQATEPPPPGEVPSADELFFIGEHLEQYRHPTRDPELYWHEALARDPGDARCNLAVGRRRLRQGLLDEAASRFTAAIDRLTRLHPNPATGEAHYHLGLTRFFQSLAAGDPASSDDLSRQSRRALSKASWNYEWSSSADYLLACLACRRRDFEAALARLEASLAANRDHNKARVLRALVLATLDRRTEAETALAALLAVDPLDHWARHAALVLPTVARASRPWSHPADRTPLDTFLDLTRNDAQTILDLAFDYAEAGFRDEATALLGIHHENPVIPVAVPNPHERSPMTRYALAWLTRDPAVLAEARAQSPDYFFPSRIHEQLVLEWAAAQPGPDPVARYALGNCYYHKGRRHHATGTWESARSQTAHGQTGIPQIHRNLGIAYWNHRNDGEQAVAAYRRALELDPSDARLVSEFDQLARKLNHPLGRRLAFLEERRPVVLQRDDASVALASLYNLLHRPGDALDLLLTRRFHPWEGGEGKVLRQYTTARLLLGRQALAAGDPAAAHQHFTHAMDTPDSLGEKYHLLQAKADVNYWIGRSARALGRDDEARTRFEASAGESGDFTEMAVTKHSPLSYFRGLSLRELGREDEARTLFDDLRAFGEAGLHTPATIDYFATSLPNLLVFDEDLKARRNAGHHLLIALACHGLGHRKDAASHLANTLAFTNSDQHAADLARDLDTKRSRTRDERP